MKVAVYIKRYAPHSVRSYITNLHPYFEARGIEVLDFSTKAIRSEMVDLYWDPNTGREGPNPLVTHSETPYIVTFHGAAHFTLPATQIWQPVHKAFVLGPIRRIQSFYSWRWRLSKPPAQIISVSRFAQQELQAHLGYASIPIYHGVDLDVFQPVEGDKEFFLHVSSLGTKKNVSRCLEAYHRLDVKDKPDFVLISGGSNHTIGSLVKDGVRLIDEYVPHEKLVWYYQRAIGFIFPSLHETFGMPIVEAMASGCPVITSNTTACAEVSGDAALLVDPYSVESIAQAMKRLVTEKDLPLTLRHKGLAHAQQFSWKQGAVEHIKVFEQAVQDHP